MSKSNTQSEISARSQEREALATAIRVRDAGQAEDDALKEAKARAASDRFKAARDVEACERALAKARETARSTLVDAYVDNEEVDDRDVADAETALTKARRRLADLQTIADELSSHGQAPGRSIPALKVTEAARLVVRSHPAVRRLTKDFAIAKRAFQQYEATLIWLAGLDCIPEDLLKAAPAKGATRYAEPDPAWTAALEALRTNPDEPLPE
jgi:hypothetical protein